MPIIIIGVMLLIFFGYTVVVGVRDGVRKAKSQQDKKEIAKGKWSVRPVTSANGSSSPAGIQPPKPGQIDSLNIPAIFSPEEKEFILKVSSQYQKRYISQDDIDKYNLETMDRLFQAMEGWKEWDSSIHHATGQFDRMRRTDKVHVEWYSPVHEIGKVIGSGGNAYLTSCHRCSCPDYRARKLPCKHMYALAMELDGDTSKIIKSPKAPLQGLSLALAGNFGSVNNPNGIRQYINQQKGAWETAITRETSALIVGPNASENKIAIARNYDMEIISEESLRELFYE